MENSRSELQWVIDASNSTKEDFCFVHLSLVNSYIQSGGKSTGMGVSYSSTPPGLVGGVIHFEGEEELKKWIDSNMFRLKDILPEELLSQLGPIEIQES